MIAFLLLFLLPSAVFGAFQNNDACNDDNLRKNFLEKVKEIAKSEDSVPDLSPFIELALQMSPEQRAEAFTEFCTENGIQKGSHQVANCIIKHLLHEVGHAGLRHDTIHSTGHHHMEQLLRWLLMDRVQMHVELLHDALVHKWNVVPFFTADNSAQLDHLFEIFLTMSHAGLRQLMKAYNESHHSKDWKHALENLVKHKDVDRDIADLLEQRVEQGSKRRLEKTIEQLGNTCKHWQTLYGDANSNSNSDEQNLDKLSHDEAVLGLLEIVKKLLIHFEPDSDEAHQIAAIWQSDCGFLNGHIFHEEKDQLLLDTLQRMLIIADLMTPGSRTVYFQEQFVNAVTHKDLDELNRLIATRANVDLLQIIEANYGQCSANQEEEQSRNQIDTHALLQQLEYNKAMELIYHNKHYTKVLKVVLDTFTNAECYRETGEKVQIEGQKKGSSNPFAGMASPSNCTCPAAGKGGNYMTAKQMEKVQELLARHGQLGMEQQGKFLMALNDVGQTIIKTQCKKARKKDEKLQKQQQEIQRKGKEATEKQRNHWQNVKILVELCGVEAEASKAKKKDKKDHKEYTDLFIQYFAQMGEDAHKLESFNSLLQQHPSRSGQFLMDHLLSWQIFDRFRRMPIMLLFNKMLHPVEQSPEQGPVTRHDIKQLVDWHARLHKMHEVRHHDKSHHHHDHDKGGAAKLRRRRRKRQEPISDSAIVAFLFLICLVEVVGIIACCALVDGDPLFCIVCIFWIIWLIGKILEAMANS